MKILYAGDSPVGGAANYLLGVLGSTKAKITHIPPSQELTRKMLSAACDVILLSDFSKKNLPGDAEKLLVEKVQSGTGLMMVGGWGSFSGPFGGWKGSLVEELLPVSCASGDDRTNFPGGASVGLVKAHPAVRGISFTHAPVICGMNRVTPKKNSATVLGVRKILSNGKKISLDSRVYPLLVTGTSGGRTAAFTTDFAPHWCGGLVDWGSRTCTLPVNSKIRIQVGDRYVALIRSLVTWLSGH